MSEVITVGLDIAKHVFHAHGVDDRGRPIFSKRISRGKLLDFFAAQPSCMVALEACGGAHHWARQLIQASRRGAPKGSWLEQMLARKPRMLVTVALANKMARIVWALLVKRENYKAPVAAKA